MPVVFFLPRPSTGSSHVEMEWSRRPSIKQADFSQEIRDRLYSEGALNRATGYHRGGMSSFSIFMASA